MSDTDDIFSFVRFECCIFCVDQIKKMTSLESNSSWEFEGIECESDDPHTCECSRSADTPDLIDTISIDEIDDFPRELGEVISFWEDGSIDRYSIFYDKYTDIGRERIDEEYRRHKKKWS